MGQAYGDCDSKQPDLQEVMNELLVVDNLGNVGLRYMRKTASAGNITQKLQCDSGLPVTPLEALVQSIGLTATGKKALILIEET